MIIIVCSFNYISAPKTELTCKKSVYSFQHEQSGAPLNKCLTTISILCWLGPVELRAARKVVKARNSLGKVIGTWKGCQNNKLQNVAPLLCLLLYLSLFRLTLANWKRISDHATFIYKSCSYLFCKILETNWVLT